MHKSSFYQMRRLDAAMARAQREAALKAQNGRCAYCLDPLTLKQVTRDHVRPRSAGGLDDRGNIKAACAPCKRLKGSMSYGRFMQMIRDPKPGAPIAYRMVWVSYRLNTALIRLEKRVMARIGRRV